MASEVGIPTEEESAERKDEEMLLHNLQEEAQKYDNCAVSCITAIYNTKGLSTQQKISTIKTLIASAETIDSQTETIDSQTETIDRQTETIDSQTETIDRQTETIDRQTKTIDRQKDLVEDSLLSTYLGDDGDTFKLPPMPEKKSIKSSTGGHQRSITIYNEKLKPQVLKYNIPTASIHPANAGLWVDPKEVKIPVKKESGRLISSLLGSKFTQAEAKGFTYENEFDVQALCMIMIEDALKSLGYTRDYIKAHLEISIYSLKPDIMVVIKKDGHIIFPIEVKCPADEVFTSKHVSGQMWSYLLMMQQMGARRPMGAIMTYNKIALVTLDDNFSEDDEHKGILERVVEALNTGVQPKHEILKAQVTSCHLRTTESPIRKSTTSSKSRAGSKEEVKTNLYEKTVDRKVYYSKIFEDGDVFPCLVQALEVAYQYGTTDDRASLLTVVNQGDSLANRAVFKIGEAECTWVRTPTHTETKGKGEIVALTATVNDTVPNGNVKELYILGKLGEGGKGSVHVVSSAGGVIGAVKMYCIEPSNCGTIIERRMEEDARRLERFKEALQVAKRWGIVYRERFQGVRALFLGGQPCLLMTYGQELQHRWLYMSRIRTELLRLANLEEHFRFEPSDLRWRHILLDSKKSIFFCDLESLEQFDLAKEDANSVVTNQLKILAAGLTEEEISKAFQCFLSYEEGDLTRAMRSVEGSGLYPDVETFITAMKHDLTIDKADTLREANFNAKHLSGDVRLSLVMMISCLHGQSEGDVDASSPSTPTPRKRAASKIAEPLTSVSTRARRRRAASKTAEPVT